MIGAAAIQLIKAAGPASKIVKPESEKIALPNMAPIKIVTQDPNLSFFEFSINFPYFWRILNVAQMP